MIFELVAYNSTSSLYATQRTKDTWPLEFLEPVVYYIMWRPKFTLYETIPFGDLKRDLSCSLSGKLQKGFNKILSQKPSIAIRRILVKGINWKIAEFLMLFRHSIKSQWWSQKYLELEIHQYVQYAPDFHSRNKVYTFLLSCSKQSKQKRNLNPYHIRTSYNVPKKHSAWTWLVISITKQMMIRRTEWLKNDFAN